MSVQDITLILHLLLFAYWLGGDIGVFYSSGFAINSKHSLEARQIAGKIMINLDLVPRLCLSLMLTVGGILSESYGIEHDPLFRLGIILLGPVWFSVLLYIHFNEGTDLVKKMTRIDYIFRWVMMFAIIISVTMDWTSGRLDSEPWIGAKLLLFATLIFCGIMIRKYIGGFAQGIHKIASGSINDQENKAMADSLSKCRVFVLTIWAILLVEAAIGVIKPGSESVNQSVISHHFEPVDNLEHKALLKS